MEHCEWNIVVGLLAIYSHGEGCALVALLCAIQPSYPYYLAGSRSAMSSPPVKLASTSTSPSPSTSLCSSTTLTHVFPFRLISVRYILEPERE